ncbi:MAG: type II toxin-antitoxin system PemK/MazF family toxin [Nitrospirae bacterium]|nr:type II toxin-antitoxin system PemK/MazF family toxin [Nitrospirota bacterium]
MNYSKGDVILLSYPFTDLKTTKVRPAVVASSEDGRYSDVFVVPVTSRIENLNIGEFELRDWGNAGLNITSAVKRGCVLVDTGLIKLKVGRLSKRDIVSLNKALKQWLEL